MAARFAPFYLVLLTVATFHSPLDARPLGEMGFRLGTKRLSAPPEGDHTCFVRADGNVLCWGNNAAGQIGDGTRGNVRDVPTPAAGVTTAVSVAAGRDHTCALLSNGAVRCWGSNSAGQLGLGSGVTEALSPTVVPNLNRVVSLAAGTEHTCARLSDGTARCWGSNAVGQIGDGTRVGPRFTPTPVTALTDAVTIAAGANHTCAVRARGVASCWGGNGQGQLGAGDFSAHNAPFDVVDATGFTELTAGRLFTCGRRGNGDVLCWGDNDLGQLGSGTTSNNSPRPIQTALGGSVVIPTKAIGVSAGRDHACALTFSSLTFLGLACWGRNQAGQLGIGSTSAVESVPRPIAERAVESAAGQVHTCDLLANDAVRCWGANALGQLGNDSTEPATTPTPVLGLLGTISARGVAVGGLHSCAWRADGTAACWGSNVESQLGDGTFTDRPLPTAVAYPGHLLSALAGGGEHTCAMAEAANGITPNQCWGNNRDRQSDFGSLLSPPDDNAFPDVDGSEIVTQDQVVSASAGLVHGCDVSAGGTVACRGNNDFRQLGDNVAIRPPRSTNVGGFTDAVDTAAGQFHSCALRANGRVFCWGDNSSGQLGDGTRNPSATPRDTGLTSAVALSSSGNHACALLASGLVACWGRNDFGQADPVTAGTDRLVPTPVATLAAGDAVAVSAGDLHTCVLTATGTVRCWGGNEQGQLGNNTTTDSPSPVTVRMRFQFGRTVEIRTLTEIVGLVSDLGHTCALRVNGQPFCWGRNLEGQIGNGTPSDTRPLATGVGSFTANIAREATLAGRSRIARIEALVNCPEGARFTAEILVVQGTVSGRGQVSGDCTGGVTEYPAVVPARGRDGFAPGPANATVDLAVKSHGQLIDAQQWARRIELLP